MRLKDEDAASDDWMTDLDRTLKVMEEEEIALKREERKGRKERAGGHWADSVRRPEVALRITVADDEDEDEDEENSTPLAKA